MRALFTAIIGAAMCLALGACAIIPGALAAPISVEVRQVAIPLSPTDPQVNATGALRYRGGFELTSPDDSFGGFSGLWVSKDGKRLIAVSDTGNWLESDLALTDGWLAGISNVRMGPIWGPNGRPLGSKRAGDAEGLTHDGTSFYVSFERLHRVMRFDGPDTFAPFTGTPVKLPGADGFESLSANKSLEAITTAGDKLLVFSEDGKDRAGNIRGWIGEKSGITEAGALTLKTNSPYAVTDLAELPGGDILVLERRYSPFAGPGMQIRRIRKNAIRSGTILDGEVIARLGVGQSVDNMEGMTVVALDARTTGILLISDNNFSPVQRTLLMLFALEE